MSFSGTAAARSVEPEQPRWLSAYLYTHASLDDLLVHRIAPLVSAARPMTERFFFIRYWEGGAHLRLRFFGVPALLLTCVLPELERGFEAWRLETPGPHRLEFVPYEPETERYGGPEALPIAEDLFHLSSRVVLQILAHGSGTDAVRGAGLSLHVTLAHAFGMSRAEAAGFFDTVMRSRVPATMMPALRDSAKRQGAPLCTTIWDALEQGCSFEAAWLDEWIEGLREIAAHLHAIAMSPSTRWMVLSSYVHMTNNRLGITGLDEPFVAALLSQALA